MINDPGYFQFGNHGFRRRQGRRPRHGRHVPARSSSRATPTTTSLANDLGVDADARAVHAPFGFGQQDRHRPRRRGDAACCRPPSGSARPTARSRSSRSGTPARRSRSASARATTTSRCCRWRSATATLVAGGQRYKPRLVREIEDVVTPRAQARGQRGAAAAAAASRSTSTLITQRAVRRDAGRHVGARRSPARPTRPAARPAPRRRSAIKAEREVQRRQARRAPARPLAVHRLRAARERRRSRWRWWSRTPASAPARRRRSRAGCSTTCCSASTRARKTWRRRARASRATPIGTPRPIDAVPLPGRRASTASPARERRPAAPSAPPRAEAR